MKYRMVVKSAGTIVRLAELESQLCNFPVITQLTNYVTSGRWLTLSCALVATPLKGRVRIVPTTQGCWYLPHRVVGWVKEDNPFTELRTCWYIIGTQETLANTIVFVFGISTYTLLYLPNSLPLHTSGTQLIAPSYQSLSTKFAFTIHLQYNVVKIKCLTWGVLHMKGLTQGHLYLKLHL